LPDRSSRPESFRNDRFLGEQNRQVVTDIVIDDPKGTWVVMLAAGKLGRVYDEEEVQILKRSP
jgi:hypothetical protein